MFEFLILSFQYCLVKCHCKSYRLFSTSTIFIRCRNVVNSANRTWTLTKIIWIIRRLISIYKSIAWLYNSLTYSSYFDRPLSCLVDLWSAVGFEGGQVRLCLIKLPFSNSGSRWCSKILSSSYGPALLIGLYYGRFWGS